jgi:hypothetical protein
MNKQQKHYSTIQYDSTFQAKALGVLHCYKTCQI